MRSLPFLALLLLLLGVGVRCRHYLAASSYWYDEAYLLLNVFEKDYVGLIGPLSHDQAAPPVFLWTLRLLYRTAGPSEWVMRLPAFVASLLAVVLMIPLARRVVSGTGWVWAAGWCALCLHGVNHGMEVKPYAWDLLATLLLVWAAARYFSDDGFRRQALLILTVVAVAAPWCSLPSVFVLGGLSAALFVDWRRQPDKRRLAAWVIVNACCLVSCLALWYGVLRQQRTHSLEQYWAEFFGDTSSVFGFLRWCVRCLVAVGNYGSNGLGVPFLLLAVPGSVLLWRRSPALTVLLTVPVALALAASLFRFYPLADRLSFFLVPCLWLLAAETVGQIVELLGQRSWRRWVVGVGLASLLLLLLGPGAVQFGKNLFVFAPRIAFRDAFEYVERQRGPEDLCWVSHPEVFEVYCGRVPWRLSSYLPLPELARKTAGHRVWAIGAREPNGPGSLLELEASLRQAGMKRLASREYPALLVHLYGPAETESLR